MTALHGTADLCDQWGAQAQVCLAPLKSYGGRRAASGILACVRCFEDTGVLRSQLAQPGAGRVLVVDGGASLRVAILGDNMARLGMDNGWRGVVIHGAVRDVESLSSMDFAVLALGPVPARAGNRGLGEHGAEVAFGNTVFQPGHFICFDPDGVVVLPSVPV